MGEDERFHMSYDDGLLRFVKDEETGENMDILDCVEKLNDLNEKIESQRRQIKGLVLMKNSFIEDCCRLTVDNKKLKQDLFEARRDYIIDTADISDQIYLEDEIEALKREMFE